MSRKVLSSIPNPFVRYAFVHCLGGLSGSKLSVWAGGAMLKALDAGRKNWEMDDMLG